MSRFQKVVADEGNFAHSTLSLQVSKTENHCFCS